MRVLYVYANARKARIERMREGKEADTQLYGLNHLEKEGIDATYKEFDDVFPAFLGRILPFNVRHSLMYFGARGYDVVFGPTLTAMMVWKKFLGRRRQKYVLLNINLTRTLTANKGSLRARILLWLVRQTDAVVCLSSAQKIFLTEVYGLKGDHMHVVPLGVDITFFPYISPVSRGEVILSAGRDNGRDYQTVIDVARRMPERQFEIVCSRRNMEGITDIPPNVTVEYDIPLVALTEKYQKAGVLLLTMHDARHPDGGGSSGQTVLLESMASGLPIVTTQKEGNDDYVTHGAEAYEVPSYDVEAIVAALREMSDADRRIQLAEAARAKVESRFTTVHMARNLAEVFKKYR